jgi:hypothetical protein
LGWLRCGINVNFLIFGDFSYRGTTNNKSQTEILAGFGGGQALTLLLMWQESKLTV